MQSTLNKTVLKQTQNQTGNQNWNLGSLETYSHKHMIISIQNIGNPSFINKRLTFKKMAGEGTCQGLKRFSIHQTNAMCGPCLHPESSKLLKNYKT